MPSENGLKKSDFECKSSDLEKHLDKVLESNDEIVSSSVITIKPSSGKTLYLQVTTKYSSANGFL